MVVVDGLSQAHPAIQLLLHGVEGDATYTFLTLSRRRMKSEKGWLGFCHD